ncbi:LLM class flavin-dependent oxidoreductase [Burkholderia cepacia]|uniref:LLM class flavin-dependent oxidoreductase n=1 Tax=Burkholderia cepacia TaxID=292 RepID=UPI003513D49C
MSEALKSETRPLAALLDQSGITYAVVGLDRLERETRISPSPTICVAVLARLTRRVGLIAAVCPQRDHPYNFARRAASLDHFSHGRSGVVVLREDRRVDLGAARKSSWTPDPIDSAAAADSVVAARALWRTWPIESLDSDAQKAAAATIRLANHDGIFRSKGPLNSPTTPQTEPIVFWPWDGEDPETELHLISDATDVVLVRECQVDGLLSSIRSMSGELTRPLPFQIHVRTASQESVHAVIERWAQHSDVSGVCLTNDADMPLNDFLVRLAELSAGDSQKTENRSSSGATLRRALDVPLRLRPDLRDNPTAFARATKEAW